MTTVAIMQPTYLPWIGYFGLMDKVSVFVLLDSVQFARRSWQQRNQIKTANGAQWITVPVYSKGARDQLITDTIIDRSRDFPEKHVRAIDLAYKKAAHFESYAPELFGILRRGHVRLTDLTLELIYWLRDRIGIQTPIFQASQITASGRKADLLANICRAVGADRYLSPPGSRGYMEESSAFGAMGIAVDYHDYLHPQYTQLYGQFLPYMSVLDLLFNEGPNTLNVIRSTYEEVR